jgi:hypothetical protein
LFLAYSLPFPRLKEVWFVSGIFDAFYAYVIPFLLSYHTFCLFSVIVINMQIVLLLTIVYFIVGYRNILLHQFYDLHHDKSSKIVTLPMILRNNRTKLLLGLLYLIEIIFYSLSFYLISERHNIFFVWLIIYLFYIAYRLYHIIFNNRHINKNLASNNHFTDIAYQIFFPLFCILFLVINGWKWLLLLPMHDAKLKFYEVIYFIYRNIIFITCSTIINHLIYYFFKCLGVDLKKEKKSAIEYFKTFRGK